MGVEHPIELKNITFNHDNKAMFKDLSLVIPPGKLCAIVGPSGSGKTTLLKLMAGQLLPVKGHVNVLGQRINTLDKINLRKIRKNMGYLFQHGALFTDLNVFDNVAFPIREHYLLPEEVIRHLVLLKLEAVGLRGVESLLTKELSGGMQRRVALARTIALDPRVILYDEPLTGQDPVNVGILLRLMCKLNEALHATSVIVSHHLKETLHFVDYVFFIADGRLVDQGTPQQIQHSRSSWVRQFLLGCPDGPLPFHYPASSLEQSLWQEGD